MVERSFPVLRYVGSASSEGAPRPQPATAEPSGRISFCGSLLLGAIIVLAAAGSGIVVAAALGPVGLVQLAAAGSVALVGLALLGTWMFQCRDCRAIRYLQRYFGVMSALMLALAGLFLLAGMLGEAVGAGLAAALFGLIVATLTVGASRLDCPALSPALRSVVRR